MKKIFLSFYIIVLLLLIVACSKSSTTNTSNTTAPSVFVPTAKLLSLPAGWKYSTLINAGFPAGIELYYFDSIYARKKVKMFCIVYDSKNPLIEFKPVLASTAKKLSDFNKGESGRVLASINGGYFGGNQSYSLVKYNGVTFSANIKTLSRNFNGASTTYYPTRAAFGIASTGEPSAT